MPHNGKWQTFVFSEVIETDDDDDERDEFVPIDNDSFVIIDGTAERIDRFYDLQEEPEETDEFEQIEQVSNYCFGFIFNRHTTCATHKLQLVLKDVFEVDKQIIQLRKVCFMFIRLCQTNSSQFNQLATFRPISSI